VYGVPIWPSSCLNRMSGASEVRFGEPLPKEGLTMLVVTRWGLVSARFSSTRKVEVPSCVLAKDRDQL
jgi:hypothetical protein